jgi:protein TonB
VVTTPPIKETPDQAPPVAIETWHPEVSAQVTAPPPREVPAKAAPASPPETLAERITYVPPVYPRTARWLRTAGHVTLAIVVKADGTVAKTPRVLAENPPGQGFAQAAVEAVRSWTFSPALRKGHPVKSTVTVDIEFGPQTD